MSIPRLEVAGGAYKLTWRDELITVDVDRVVEDSKYTVTGEILVRSNSPGMPSHLHQARLNLTSTSARRTLANHLSERMNQVDWHAIIEQTCVKVLEKHREGEPVIRLSEHSVGEGLKQRVVPILQENQATVNFGHGDTGKSFLSLYLGVLVATGHGNNGFYPEPGNVMVLDYETDEDTIYDRVRMIANGLSLPIPSNVFYRYSHQTIAADIQAIQRHVLDKSVNLLIIDSATPAVGEPESAQMTAEYFRALRSLHITTLTIAHVAKSGVRQEAHRLNVPDVEPGQEWAGG